MPAFISPKKWPWSLRDYDFEGFLRPVFVFSFSKISAKNLFRSFSSRLSALWRKASTWNVNFLIITDHCQCDVTSYIGDFQNGGQISCSLRCKGCQFSECLDSSFAFFNEAELLKNNMDNGNIRDAVQSGKGSKASLEAKKGTAKCL